MDYLRNSRNHFLKRLQNMYYDLNRLHLENTIANTKSLRESFLLDENFIVEAKTMQFDTHIENANINTFC